MKMNNKAAYRNTVSRFFYSPVWATSTSTGQRPVEKEEQNAVREKM